MGNEYESTRHQTVDRTTIPKRLLKLYKSHHIHYKKTHYVNNVFLDKMPDGTFYRIVLHREQYKGFVKGLIISKP